MALNGADAPAAAVGAILVSDPAPVRIEAGRGRRVAVASLDLVFALVFSAMATACSRGVLTTIIGGDLDERLWYPPRKDCFLLMCMTGWTVVYTMVELGFQASPGKAIAGLRIELARVPAAVTRRHLLIR